MDTNENGHGKKIIHVVQHLAPGGLETLTLDLLRLAKPLDTVLIFSLEGTREDAIKQWPRLETYANHLVFLEKAPGLQPAIVTTLLKAFIGMKPDVVHTHHIGPLLYAGSAARIAGVPHRIHTEHDAWHLNNTKRRRLQNFALKTAQPMLVADATRVYRQLKDMFSHQNIVTIRNGIDCEKFQIGSKNQARSQFGLPQNTTLIGCAGRLETVKGQDLLIKALALLPSDVSLAIAGNGSERQSLEALTQKLNLSDRVIFLGLVDNMPAFYQSLDLFCLPSRHEGLPLSTLEAQACGIPTVATDVGATDETLCPKTGSLVVRPTITALAKELDNATQRLHASDPNTVSPRDYILSNFDIRKMVNAYDALSDGAYA